MRSLLAAVALLCSVVTAFAADPAGSYKVQGTAPDGSTYNGTATVTKTDETYRVVWKIGDDTYNGTAIGNADFIAISYTSSNETGLALYGPDGANWKGIWTYAGGKKIGTELWTRQ
jgi:hypothetical protein